SHRFQVAGASCLGRGADSEVAMYTVTDLERIRLTILHAEGWIERQSARLADRIRAGTTLPSMKCYWCRRSLMLKACAGIGTKSGHRSIAPPATPASRRITRA